MLNAWYDCIPGTELDRTRLIEGALDGLSDGYRRLGTAPIDYSKPESQFAYLFKYAGSRAVCVSELQCSSPKLMLLYENPELRVASVGCGPGSDLLGIVKFRKRLKSTTALSFHLVDVNPAWRESLLKLKACFGSEQAPGTFPPSHFWLSDVTVPLSPSLKQALGEVDLITISYLLSELPIEKAQVVLEGVISAARSGAAVIVVDNALPGVRSLLTTAAERVDLDAHVRETLINLPADEQTSDLGDYLTRFTRHDQSRGPHINLDSIYLSGTKR